jgi:hypothetical protein
LSIAAAGGFKRQGHKEKSIPYRGDDSHLENNWSGNLVKVPGSMLAMLAHDQDRGLRSYS